jgi:hypothetical protein
MKAIIETETGRRFEVTFGKEPHGLVVSSGDEIYDRCASLIANEIRREYVPADGGPMSSIANGLAARLRGKVIEVDNGPPDPPGLVY